MQGKYHMPRYPSYYEPTLARTLMTPKGNDGANQVLQAEVNDAQFMKQFLNADGQVDIGKVLVTVNQLADTVQQLAPLVRQVNDLVKTWKS